MIDDGEGNHLSGHAHFRLYMPLHFIRDPWSINNDLWVDK